MCWRPRDAAAAKAVTVVAADVLEAVVVAAAARKVSADEAAEAQGDSGASVVSVSAEQLDDLLASRGSWLSVRLNLVAKF